MDKIKKFKSRTDGHIETLLELSKEQIELSKEQLAMAKQKNIILNEIVNRLALIGGELGEIREQYIYSATQ